MKQLTIDNGKLTMKYMFKERGQVILTLILVMTVALAIGLSVIQKSLSDVSTSTKVEQSARAFSAAEAGIETYLKSGSTTTVTFSETGSNFKIDDQGGSQPPQPALNSRQVALEYPPFSKEDVMHVWLADYTKDPPTNYYTQTILDVYWGDPQVSDKAALELTLVNYNGSQYVARKWYLDSDSTRSLTNNFVVPATCAGNYDPAPAGSQLYNCYVRLGDGSAAGGSALPSNLMLIRARLLYNSTNQPFAVWAVGTCGTACSLPSQSKIITSTGTSGNTQRRVQVFQEPKVVPPYFDYAIFSTSEINK